MGAEAKDLDGSGRLAVCKGDLCIPLSDEQTPSFDGEVYADLSAFGDALGLQWQLSDSVLTIITSEAAPIGLAAGARPPAFALPDLYTGALVSSTDYAGRKTVFYLWASW